MDISDISKSTVSSDFASEGSGDAAGSGELKDLRVPPHSIEAEQAVLGGVMLENQAWESIADRLVESDFYRRKHQIIFQVLQQLAEQNESADVVTVSEAAKKLGLLEEAGGLAYLGELVSNIPSAANIAAYADIVRERSVMRQLISVSTDIATEAYKPDGRAIDELLDRAESRIFKIAEQTAKEDSGPQVVSDVLKKTVERIQELYTSDDALTGLSTGFTDFDNMTSGLQPSDLVIVAGRPSMGKTAFSMNLAESAAIRGDKPVLVFSMEMPADSLVMRMLSSLGRIDQKAVRSGNLSDDDWNRLTSAMGLLAERKLFIDDTPALSPMEVRARARRIARSHGDIGMILIDYLQLMQVPGADNRVAEISEISRSLKGLAKELNCPVVALSQLNRGLEQRPNKRPVMSDLRESGAIEQDADVIIFLYRDVVYNKETPDQNVAEIIIGKQRNGPIGTCRLAFLGEYTRFEDLAVGYDDYE